jgi:hypothetical protein
MHWCARTWLSANGDIEEYTRVRHRVDVCDSLLIRDWAVTKMINVRSCPWERSKHDVTGVYPNSVLPLRGPERWHSVL